jgi:Protein of unknown function (DUF4240)
MAAAILALVGVAVGAGYAIGSKLDGRHDGGTSLTAEPVATPAAPTTAPAAPTAAPAAPTAAPSAPAAMDRNGFWGLVTSTRQSADGNTGRQSSLLEERLRHLPPKEIVDYQRMRHRLDEQLYTWDVWGAAFVIEDGCSDDCFRDFRAYLISLGPNAVQTALRDPDALAPIVQDAEQGDWENADSVAGDAYEAATGEDIPADDSDLSGDPRGQPWDDDQPEALIQRYPKLAARFR